MKILFPMLICLLLAFSVKAQFSYTDDGQIIPFSMTEKYKCLIDTSKINSCKLKSYNNDSLYNALNKYNQGNAYISGIPIDTLINLKSAATMYKIKEGTVWLYKIESKTAEQLYVTIKQLEIPEGAYICLFPKEKELKIMGRQVFQKKDINTTKFLEYIYGNQMFIEYFEPNKIDRKANITISRIGYSFSSPLKKKVNTKENNDITEGHLKSGSFGSAANTPLDMPDNVSRLAGQALFLGSGLCLKLPSDSQSPATPLLLANGWKHSTELMPKSTVPHNGLAPSNYSPRTAHMRNPGTNGFGISL